MATRSTVRALQAFYSPPSAACQSPWGEYLTLVSVGSGLNGHPDTLHGGIISLLLDETLSTPADFHRTPSNTIFTATMTVDYKKPVPTPGFVLCRTWADPSSEGRKIRVAGSVEDGEGGIYAVGRALFVEVPMDAKL
ncbi:MAG: hypothetical protein M1818_005506 [Claussenomyces sp. TS43310]|nr:MAG: hypothetical protein M1818_005506 [Claussenomyces sp. TS43310]